MDIDQYIKSAGITRIQFAEMVGVSEGMVGHWITGRYRVAAERCLRVESATNGAVTRHDLRPDVFGTAPVAVSA